MNFYATGRERKEDGKPCVTNVTIFCLKNFPPSCLFVKDQKTLVLSEDIDKSAIIYRPIRFVTQKRFAVLFSLPSYCVMCSSWKYPYSPHRRDWKFLGGGVSQRPKNLSKCMMLDWNFQRGGGSKKKSLPWGRYG